MSRKIHLNVKTMKNRKSELHYVVKEIESLNGNLPTKKTAGAGGFTSLVTQIVKEAVYQSYANSSRKYNTAQLFL